MSTVGTDPEGQVKFLVNCIRFSQNGRVDFDSVASECNIVSKAAAAKRFERLLKAHGMKPGELFKGGPVGAASPSQSPAPKTLNKATNKATPKTKSGGKRTALPNSPTGNTKRAKLASHPAVSSYNDADDDEEEEQFKVKEETKADNGAPADSGSYYDDPRSRDRDDDDLQLLYVVEKTNGCPVHSSGEYRDVAQGDERFQV